MTKWDPHNVLPSWVFTQIGQLSEIVARADLSGGKGQVELDSNAEAPSPTVTEIQGESFPIQEQEVPFIQDIPEVNIPWSQPDRFFEQFVKQDAIEVSQGVQKGLGRVTEVARQWSLMDAIGMVSSGQLGQASTVLSTQVRVGETLYAEALRQVADTWTQDDVESSDIGDMEAWYWSGLAAATIALFGRAFQDTSRRVVPFTGRGTGGQQTQSSPGVARGGGGGGNFVNVAEIIQRQQQVINRRPPRPRVTVDPEVMAEIMAIEVIEIQNEGQLLGQDGNIHIM